MMVADKQDRRLLPCQVYTRSTKHASVRRLHTPVQACQCSKRIKLEQLALSVAGLFKFARIGTEDPGVKAASSPSQN